MHSDRTVYLVLWYDSDYFYLYPSEFLPWHWEVHAIDQIPVMQHQTILTNPSHESTRKDDMKYQNKAQQTLCTF